MDANRARGCAVVLLLVFFPFLLGDCTASSAVYVKMDAIRFTREAIDRESTEAVSLSLWMYDEGGDLIDHTFMSGKLVPEIQKTEWKLLNAPEGITLPRRRLSKGEPFTFQIKLNPNRLLTPPDAIFSETVDMAPLLSGEMRLKQLVIPSSNKLFELRVVFFASTPRSPK